MLVLFDFDNAMGVQKGLFSDVMPAGRLRYVSSIIWALIDCAVVNC